MFGLGNIVGGALKAVGLGKLAPIVSMGVNAFTGNFAGLAVDVMGMMSKFKGLDFMSKVAQFAPLGAFGKFDALAGLGRGLFDLSGGGNNLLKPERLLGMARDFSRLTDTFDEFSASAKKIQDMMDTLREALETQQTIQNARSRAYYSGLSRLSA